MSARLSRSLLALILGVYLCLAVGYGLASPLFETPDEHLHYFTAEFIARHGRLPTTRDPGLMAQEAAQPPLFYLLAAPIVRAFDPGGAAGQLWVNPRVDVSAVAGQLWTSPLAAPTTRGESVARPPINVNMFVHDPAEAWPWRGYALAAHLIRLLSTAFGLGTLLCIYAAGRVVWPGAPGRALLATALVACLPQFAFIHAAVSNDAAITFFCAAGLWQLLRVTSAERRVTSEERPPAAGHAPQTTDHSRAKDHVPTTNDQRPIGAASQLVTRHTLRVTCRSSLVALGLTIGLAMLSKAAGILLLVYATGVVGLVVLGRGWQGAPSPHGRGVHAWARAAGAAALVASPALLVAGWWLWRNWTLYGDVTAATQFAEMTGGYRPYTLYQVWLDMDRVWLSFFALFGWMNVQPPALVHVGWNVIVLAALVGALLRQNTRYEIQDRSSARSDLVSRISYLISRPAVLLSLWFLLVAAAWLQFMLRTSADQGRLFFPALLPLALGAAYGLSRWPRPWTQLAAVALGLVTSVYGLVAVIPPAYARPPVVAALPDDLMPQMLAFPGTMQLLATRVDTPVARPGEWVWLTLYWQTQQPLQDAPFVHLELFDPDFTRIGELVAYHGRGNYPASLWPAWDIVADRIAVRPNGDIDAPMEALLKVKLDPQSDGVDIATVKIVPDVWPARLAPLAQLGEGIELAAADLSTTTAAPGDAINLRLHWQTIAPPGPANLHLFVHLGDPGAPPLAQTDGPVMGGRYPARLWVAGEAFDETVTLTLPAGLPPGNYPIQIGLYDTYTSLRLPATIAGLREPTDTVWVGVVSVQ